MIITWGGNGSLREHSLLVTLFDDYRRTGWFPSTSGVLDEGRRERGFGFEPPVSSFSLWAR